MTRVICNLKKTCEMTAKMLGADTIRSTSSCSHASPHDHGWDCSSECMGHGKDVVIDLPAHCEEYND